MLYVLGVLDAKNIMNILRAVYPKMSEKYKKCPCPKIRLSVCSKLIDGKCTLLKMPKPKPKLRDEEPHIDLWRLLYGPKKV